MLSTRLFPNKQTLYKAIPAISLSLLLLLEIPATFAKAIPVKSEPQNRCKLLKQELGKNIVYRDLHLQTGAFKDVVAVDPETGNLFFNAAIHSPDDDNQYNDINIAGWLTATNFIRFIPSLPYLGPVTNSWIGSNSNPFTVYGYTTPVNQSHSNATNSFAFAYDPSTTKVTPMEGQIFGFGSSSATIRSSHNGAYTVLQYDVRGKDSVVASVYQQRTKVGDLRLDIANQKNLNGLSVGGSVRGISDDGNIILMDIASLGQYSAGSDIGIYVRNNSRYQRYIEQELGQTSTLTATVYKDEQYHLYVLATAGTPTGIRADGKAIQYIDRELNIYLLSVDDALQGHMPGTLVAQYDSSIPLYKCDFETTSDAEGGYSHCNQNYIDLYDPNKIPIPPSSRVWGSINKIDKQSMPFIDYMNQFFQDLLFRDAYPDGDTVSLWRFDHDEIYGRVTIGTYFPNHGGSDVIPHMFYCDLK